MAKTTEPADGEAVMTTSTSTSYATDRPRPQRDAPDAPLAGDPTSNGHSPNVDVDAPPPAEAPSDLNADLDDAPQPAISMRPGWREFKADALALPKAVNYLRLDVTSKSQTAKWQMRCPDATHPDRDPSAFVSVEGGKLGWGCAKGCHEQHGGGSLEGLVRASQGLLDANAALEWLRSNWPLGRPEPATTKPHRRAAKDRPTDPAEQRAELAKRLAKDAKPPTDRDREIADEALAMRAAACGLTLDDLAELGEHAAWQVQSGSLDLRLRLPAFDDDGEIDSYGDFRPNEPADSRWRKLDPPGSVAASPVWGRERWRDAPPDWWVVVEGESDYKAAWKLLLDDVDAAVIGFAGAGKHQPAIDGRAARCAAMGWALPPLVVVLDGDDAGDAGAARCAALWQSAGGDAVVLRLPDGDDLRAMATDGRRDELKAKLAACVELAANPAVVEPLSDEQRAAAVALAERLPRFAAGARAAARTAEATTGARWWSNAGNRVEVIAHGTASVDDQHLWLANSWRKWSDGDHETLGRGVGWRHIDDDVIEDLIKAAMRAFADTGEATGSTAAWAEAMRQAQSARRPSGDARTRRTREVNDGLPAGWRERWDVRTGEAREGVTCLDAVLRWRTPPDDWSTLADCLIVEPVSRDVVSELPPLAFTAEQMLDRARRVRRGTATADLLALVDDAPMLAGWLRSLDMTDDELTNLGQMGGCVLWGEQQRAPVLFGETSTGKTVMLEIVVTLAGSYETNDLEGLADTWATDEMANARVVALQDDSPPTRLTPQVARAAQWLKRQIRGESHKRKAKHVRKAPTERLPGVVMLVMNDPPIWMTTEGQAGAMRERIQVAEFTKPVPKTPTPSYGVLVAKAAPDAAGQWLMLCWLARKLGETTEPPAMVELGDELAEAGLSLSLKMRRRLSESNRTGEIERDHYLDAVLGAAIEDDLDDELNDDRTKLLEDGKLKPRRVAADMRSGLKLLRRASNGDRTYLGRKLTAEGERLAEAGKRARTRGEPGSRLVDDPPPDSGVVDAATGETYRLPDEPAGDGGPKLEGW